MATKQLKHPKPGKTATPPLQDGRSISLLEEADMLINGARQADYGDKLQNFAHIAMVWNGLLAPKLSSPLTPEDVTLLMIGMKSVRAAHSHSHRDSVLDIAGYAGCYDKLRMERAEGTGLPGIMYDAGAQA